MEELKRPEPAPPKKPNIVVRLLAFLLTLALVLGAVALVAFRDKINLDSLKRYITYRTLETGDDRQPTSFRLESGGKGGCLGVGDDLLVYSASGARLFSVSGVEYLTESVLLTTPVADGAGSAAVVYDAGGYALRVLSDRSTVLETSAAQGHEILSARLNAAGRLTVTSREPGYKGSVTVYTAGQTDDAFDSALALYHLDEDTPYASCSLGGSAVLDLKYDADSFWALGDEALSIVQLDGSLAGQYDYGGRYLKAFSLGGDRSATLLLGKYRAGSGATLLTVDAAGQELAALELDDQVLDLDAAGRYVAVLTAGRLDLYTRDLELYASLDTTGGARDVVLRSDGTAWLITGETARLFIPE